jgi:hypothetical protein
MSGIGGKSMLDYPNLLSNLVEGKEPLSYQLLTITGAVALVLPTIPANCTNAVTYLEADALEKDENRVVRFREDNTAPTTTLGTPLGDNDIYEIKGKKALAQFKILGITAGHTSYLHIHYYKEANT